MKEQTACKEVLPNHFAHRMRLVHLTCILLLRINLSELSGKDGVGN